MGLFSGMEGAKARVDANYERDGDYIERIDAVKTGKARTGDEFLVVEKTVLHVIDNADGKGHKVGEKISHMMMKKHDSFLGNVKAFIANTLGVNEVEVTEAKCEQVIAEKLLDGMFIRCQNRTVMTRKNTPFTAINYRGEVSAAAVADKITEAEEALIFKPGELDALIQAQA